MNNEASGVGIVDIINDKTISLASNFINENDKDEGNTKKNDRNN